MYEVFSHCLKNPIINSDAWPHFTSLMHHFKYSKNKNVYPRSVWYVTPPPFANGLLQQKVPASYNLDTQKCSYTMKLPSYNGQYCTCIISNGNQGDFDPYHMHEWGSRLLSFSEHVCIYALGVQRVYINFACCICNLTSIHVRSLLALPKEPHYSDDLTSLH